MDQSNTAFTSCNILQAAKNDMDADVVAHRLAEGEEAAEFIRTCIVQTRKTGSGDFGAPRVPVTSLMVHGANLHSS